MNKTNARIRTVGRARPASDVLFDMFPMNRIRVLQPTLQIRERTERQTTIAGTEQEWNRLHPLDAGL